MRKIASFIYNKPFLLIALFTLIAYLPVFLPFFYVKNDLISQMLPMRFFVSESLQSGFMPWWNPFVNFGIPQYGDMNGAFWNPIVWIISFTSGYDVWAITLELMLYIFLSGWGMFLLLRNLNINKKIALLGSFSFLSCGYIIGHMQHSSWITGAAFLPFILHYFIQINKNPTAKYFLYGALSIYMFLSSTHPGLVIGATYFFLFFSIGMLFIRSVTLNRSSLQTAIKNSLLFLIAGLILSVGILAGYGDIIPFITRGETVAGNESFINPTSFQSGISLIFPLAVHKSDFFNTDISMRNIHVGIVMLIGFILFFKLAGKRIALVTLFIFLFFLLLSSGGSFKLLANIFLPGIAFIRSSGEFSLFTCFTMILAGAYGLNLYMANRKNEPGESKLLIWLKYLFGLATIVSIISIFLSNHSAIFNLQSLRGIGLKSTIKSTLDAITINDLFLLQSCISFGFIFLFSKLSSRHHLFRYLTVTAYLVVISWLCLPFTGLGTKSKQEINSLLLSAPKGINIQPLNIADKTIYIDSSNFALAGIPNAYSKQISIPFDKEYPINIKTNARLFDDSLLLKFIEQQAYVFLSMDTTINSKTSFDSNNIVVRKLSPGFIEAEVNNDQFNYFTFTQTNYRHWNVYINDSPVQHFTGFGSFLTVGLPKGKSIVKFGFYPKPVSIAAYISFALLILTTALLIFLEMRGLRKGTV